MLIKPICSVCPVRLTTALSPDLNVLDSLAATLVPGCFSLMRLSGSSVIPIPLERRQGLRGMFPGGYGLFLAPHLPEQ